MLQLFSLLIFMLSLSACGSDSNIDGDHSRVKVTYKDISNVVFGTFPVPAGETIIKVQLSSDGSFTGALLTASPCHAGNYNYVYAGSGAGFTAPSALYCPDNSFYFSGVTSASSVARATLSNGEFLYLSSPGYRPTADVSVVSKDDWHGEDGTTIEID